MRTGLGAENASVANVAFQRQRPRRDSGCRTDGAQTQEFHTEIALISRSRSADEQAWPASTTVPGWNPEGDENDRVPAMRRQPVDILRLTTSSSTL